MSEKKVSKYYVVSLTICKTPQKALELIKEKYGDMDFNPKVKVYEITETVKIFKPSFKLEEEKGHGN
jgi:ribosomal protein S24E